MIIKNILLKIKNNQFNLVNFAREIIFFGRFFILLFIYLIKEILILFGKIKPIAFIFKPANKPLANFYEKIIKVFDTYEQGDITSIDLIVLATRHLKAKKSRTAITIGGMAIGFGAIIFLLSLGYGFQRLVVSKVARLEEMKQIDVTIGQATSLSLNDQAIKDFMKMEEVETVLPLISVVSKVSFNGSVSDVVAYGVTSQFLEQSAIKPTIGEIFKNENLSFSSDEEDLSLKTEGRIEGGQVAGAKTERLANARMEKEIFQIKYSIYPLVWKPVFEKPSSESTILGYASRVVGQQEAVEVWGHSYDLADFSLEGIDSYNNIYNRWVRDTFPLWKKVACDLDNTNCVGGEYLMLRDGSGQLQETGFITEDSLVVDRFEIISKTNPKMVEGKTVDQVQFSIKKGAWLAVYSQAKKDRLMLNLFTKATEPLIKGDLVSGEYYYDSHQWGNVGQNENDKQLGYWIRTTVPLWRRIDCGDDCGNYYLTEKDGDNKQINKTVFIQVKDVIIEDMSEPSIMGQVLGEATGSARQSNELASSSAVITDAEEATGEGDLDWVLIASAAGIIKPVEKDILLLKPNAKKQAIINYAMIKLLGIEEIKALEEIFNTVFIFNGEFFGKDDYQAESEEAAYTIIGVIPDGKAPAFYLPFNDIKGVGVKNFSQIKIVVKNQNDLKKVRKAVESMGFKTSSVVDTVGKINSLFDTIRIALFLIGLIALGVASLGMFNTLTVSLLEKTREVGLMKAMGMSSNEVQRLFLAESIIIGLGGGAFGLLLGFMLGKLVSFFLSTISITKGMGVIDVVYIPASLVFIIIVLSFVIGVLTGIFPARRATKISALNALRYE